MAFTRHRATQPRLFPFGHYALLQMIGVTFPELQDMKASSNQALVR
ncbi:MAG TPA: hypothetical protein VFY45_20140 [Baekduia sp.]|nr:hypothetical protein [Baekduia sp.]